MRLVEASVGAVTSLNNELFVALHGSRQIHVYHGDDLQFIRCLPVDDLGAQVTCLPYICINTAKLTYIDRYNSKEYWMYTWYLTRFGVR